MSAVARPETPEAGVRRVVLAAGGTGGHMFPAQALARALIGLGREVVLITDRRGGGFGPELPQVETHRINAGGIAGGSPLRKLASLWLLGIGYLQARALLKQLGAEAVVGFGGYPSVPTVLAGARRGLRVVLHEQNAIMGRANRLLARHADRIATSFGQVGALPDELHDRVVLTGNPVRAAVGALGRRPYAVPGEADPLRLLVIGGSQGAVVFNGVIPAAVARLPETLRRRLRVSQQVRGRDLSEVADEYRESGVEAELAPFFEDLPERLAEAHLVICRAGASTVAELAAAGRPAILVPYPFATDDHQTANGGAFAEAGGGWLMPQSELNPERLAERLAELLDQPSLLGRAAGCARSQARLEAAERLAALVCGEREPNGGAKDGEGREEAAA